MWLVNGMVHFVASNPSSDDDVQSHMALLVHNVLILLVIRFPLFASAKTEIYPHAALQYHARPNAKRGIAMLSVDKFPYPRKQTGGNEFIPCSNDVCQILKCFRSFKISETPFIWPKSPYKYSVARSPRSGQESGRRSWSPFWLHQWRSFLIIIYADDVKREIRVYTSRLLTNQKRESAPSMAWDKILYPCSGCVDAVSQVMPCYIFRAELATICSDLCESRGFVP